MKQVSAKIIADSINEQGDRITTFILTFPRFILAELNTHRMFSRNSASSRAIPFEKMVKMVEEDPFIPIAWQKDHKGMQGVEYLDIKVPSAIAEWLRARDQAVRFAIELNKNHNVTKQLCNRLLEPFMWHTALVTSTEWENFFYQRCPYYEVGWYPESRSPEALEPTMSGFRSRKDAIKGTEGECNDLSEGRWRDLNLAQAEIHMQTLAEAMWDAMNESVPKKLEAGSWHIPFGDKIDEQLLSQVVTKTSIGWYYRQKSFFDNIQLEKLKIATARCARVSYNTFDGTIDYNKDIELHNRLLVDGHMSPFEHCARAMTQAEYNYFVKGKLTPHEFLMEISKEHAGWCNNFKGFIPYRYMVENNYV